MNVLGLVDYPWSHDMSAAIVCDGVLVAAVEEERFTRVKHQGGVALNAVDFCLRAAGLRMDQVDLIAFPDLPFRTGRDSYMAAMPLSMLQQLRGAGKSRFRAQVHSKVLQAYLRTGLPFSFNWQGNPITEAALRSVRERYGLLPKVRYCDHHLAHAAAAYFASGMDSAAVVTVDGQGGPYATVTWAASGNRIRLLRAQPFTNSLGYFYSDCTAYLGLGDYGEGKAMGLAAYGSREAMTAQVEALIDTRNCAWYCYRQKPSKQVLGFEPLAPGECPVQAPYQDFAAACQRALEQAVERIVSSAVAETGVADVCLGGGVALNCSSNGALLASGKLRSLWVFPASGDAGLAVGAALLCAAEMGELRRQPLTNAYLGPEFSPSGCEVALAEEPRLSYSRPNHLAGEVARALAAGAVAGWFQGRMEIGPRALGNRSILADPRRRETHERVNRIKGREMWRPLAPVVLMERAGEFFQPAAASPFMLFAFQVRAEKRDLIPAVVHVDGSARPQTVTREQNPRLYDLLIAFEKESGVPILLNTSFNLAGEPIVCTPRDAIRSFLASKLDLLVLGDFVARRREANG